LKNKSPKKDELSQQLALAMAVQVPQFQAMAIVAALAARKLLEPADVARQVEFFANGIQTSRGPLDPAIAREIAAQLRDFADTLGKLPASTGGAQA
jgi:hypothetical protein